MQQAHIQFLTQTMLYKYVTSEIYFFIIEDI